MAATQCDYCNARVLKPVEEEYNGETFKGHPGCKDRWKYRMERIEAGTYGTRGENQIPSPWTPWKQAELPFTPDKVEEDAVSQADLEALAEMKSIANGDLQPVINRLVQANDELFRENQALRETVKVLLA